MKAGILTFHQADNYGAVLQAYALQTTLSRLGVESEFVAFDGDGQRPGAPPAQSPPFAKKLWAEQGKRAALFDRFRKTRLVCAESISKERAGELDGQYDVFIAGSDQVWNFQVPGADGRYFLPFAAPGKRVSYAASFGMDVIPEDRRDWYAQRLNGFRTISVREKRGQELVRELTGRDCAVCLDPVLLLSREDWQELAPPAGGVPYVFLHMVQFDKALLERAKAFAAKQGLELRIATAGYVPQCGFPAWSETGVEQWVGLIQNAAYVFTNSFHAVAFSLLFGSPVSAAPLQEKLSGRNGRVAELLECAGMTECLGGGPKAVSPEQFAERLDSLQRASIQYLRDAVAPDSTGKG